MSYNQCFVPNFAQLTKPLHALVGKTNGQGVRRGEKNEPFVWIEEFQDAFGRLRASLLKPLMMFWHILILSFLSYSPHTGVCMDG